MLGAWIGVMILDDRHSDLTCNDCAAPVQNPQELSSAQVAYKDDRRN